MAQNVPLFDCRLDANARQALDQVLASGDLASGSFVGELESRLDAMFPGRTSVALSDMTQALAMALRMSGVGVGDDVLTLAFNCMSSNSAIAMVGARAIWVDVNPHTLTIDMDDCERALTRRVKALVVYHVAGYPANISALEVFCEKHGIVLIEDANNAIGAYCSGRRAGTAGSFSIFSFYANRQINAIEGAALLCAKPEDAIKARRLRRFGVDVARFRDINGEIAPDFDVHEIGLPASMTNVNACLACHQLEQLEVRLGKVRANAEVLRDGLIDTGVVPVSWSAQDGPAFWALAVQSSNRDSIMCALKAAGVQCSKLHQRNDRYSGFKSTFRELAGTTTLENQMFVLPVGWWVTTKELSLIIEIVKYSCDGLAG